MDGRVGSGRPALLRKGDQLSSPPETVLLETSCVPMAPEEVSRGAGTKTMSSSRVWGLETCRNVQVT